MTTPTYDEALAAQERRRAEDRMDAMWAARDRTPTFGGESRASHAFGLIAGAVLIAVAVVALTILAATRADAHTPTVSGTCDSLTVKLASYNGAQPNSVAVTIDGATVLTQNFRTDFAQTFPLDPTKPHEWSVRVFAHDDPKGKKGWTFTAVGSSSACVTEPPTSEPPTTEPPTTTPPTTPPQPKNEVEEQFSDTVDCDANHVVVQRFERQAGYYLGEDNTWHLGEFGEWVLVETFTRDLNPGELEACEPEETTPPVAEPPSEEPPTTEPPTEPPTTEPPVTEPPTDTPSEPEPTTPVEPEPTTPEPTTPVEPSTEPTPDIGTPTSAERIITPDVPVQAQSEGLPETGAHGEVVRGGLAIAAVAFVLGVLLLWVRRIGARR